MQHIFSWIAHFPGLVWSTDITPARLHIHNKWSFGGVDIARFFKDKGYRKRIVCANDYPLLVEFIDMMTANLPATVIFRIRGHEEQPLLMQGWPASDGKSYCGMVKHAFLPATFMVDGMRGSCQMALGSAEYPVFAIDVPTQKIVAQNKAALDLFAPGQGQGATLSLAGMASKKQARHILEACEQALANDVWAGTLTFGLGPSTRCTAKVRLTACDNSGQVVRVALLNILRSKEADLLPESLDAGDLASVPPLREGLERLLTKHSQELDGLMFSDIQSHRGKVVVYGVGPTFADLGWGIEHDYEGTIAQEIERFGLHSLTVDETLDSIKSIDWVLFTPHGVRSYFAMPFYAGQALHAVLILASTRPGAFGVDASQRFAGLFSPFELLVNVWRTREQTPRRKKK